MRPDEFPIFGGTSEGYVNLQVPAEHTDEGLTPIDLDMSVPEAEHLAIRLLLKAGWSLNGVGKAITSVTPRSPRPLSQGRLGPAA